MLLPKRRPPSTPQQRSNNAHPNRLIRGVFLFLCLASGAQLVLWNHHHYWVYYHQNPQSFDADSLDAPAVAREASRESHGHHQSTTTNRNSTATTLLPRGTGSIDAPHGWENRFLVVPEHKLLLCYVEKVGCTMLNDIVRILRMVHPDVNQSETNRLARHRWFVNTPLRHGLTTEALEGLHTDPEWTKAVFFRDPATRFLSAYRSKCVPPREEDGETCAAMFGLGEGFFQNQTFSFDDALERLQNNASRVLAADWHTMPQARFCGGLLRTLPTYDAVHPLTHATSGATIGGLLARVGVPARVIEGIQQCFTKTPQNCRALRSLAPKFPFAQMRRHYAKHHRGGSAAKGGNTSALAAFYQTNERLRIVQEAYRIDYNVFHYRPRTLEELETAGV